MSNLASITQRLANIDYAWNKPETYVVLIPGLSLIVQKIQLANVLPIKNDQQQTAQEIDAKSRKFANICKWHLRGSMVQIVACIIAVEAFALPLFLLVFGVAVYEMVDTLAESLKRKNGLTLCEFNPDGSVKSQVSASACNIF